MNDTYGPEINPMLEQKLLKIYQVSPRSGFLSALGNELTEKARARSERVEKRSFFARRNFRSAIAFALIALAILAVVLVSPPGRAFAQQILHFFIPTEEQSRPLPALPTDETLDQGIFADGLAKTCPQDDLDARYICQLSYVEKEMGFPVKAVPSGEHDLVFSNLEVDAARKIVHLFYGYAGYPGTDGSIWIAQGIGEFPARIREDGENDWGEVLAQSIESVTVNGQDAEFVVGQWVLLPGDNQYVWSTDVPGMTLRWRDGEHWFQIFKGGQPEMITNMDKKGLIQLAESLKSLSK